ncbi:MAG: Lrp/AsnC family transcriptional regulator [Caulobacterales bacterium]|jgi:DNA-binding Lrp family transcriptional regulator
MASFAEKSQSMIELDDFDRKILRVLATDGRVSNLDLAARIGLSASACLRRVQALEKSGAIRGYRAVLDPAVLGGGFLAYVLVGLSRHTRAEQRAFEAAIANAPQVRECHNITGAFEYLLRIEAADLAAYKHFHTEVLGALPQVTTITSYIVMESAKDERA